MEGVDNGGIGLDRIALNPDQVDRIAIEHRSDLLGGVTVLRGTGTVIEEDGWNDHVLYRRNKPSPEGTMDVMAIPYATWDNRAPGEMRVWFRAD